MDHGAEPSRIKLCRAPSWALSICFSWTKFTKFCQSFLLTKYFRNSDALRRKGNVFFLWNRRKLRVFHLLVLSLYLIIIKSIYLISLKCLCCPACKRFSSDYPIFFAFFLFGDYNYKVPILAQKLNRSSWLINCLSD